MQELIYFGALRIQSNAHIKPRGKRKFVPDNLKEFRNVGGCVWAGEDAQQLNKRPHTIDMVCKLTGIKNHKAVKIVAIVNKKRIGKTNLR